MHTRCVTHTHTIPTTCLCIAHAHFGSSRPKPGLSPTEPPQVTLELQQEQDEVSWGETVRFSCQARGKPAPAVVWLHNARPLAPSPRHRVTARALRVLNVGPQDQGLYQCMAENGVGSAQASARLVTVPTGECPQEPIE